MLTQIFTIMVSFTISLGRTLHVIQLLFLLSQSCYDVLLNLHLYPGHALCVKFKLGVSNDTFIELLYWFYIKENTHFM